MWLTFNSCVARDTKGKKDHHGRSVSQGYRGCGRRPASNAGLPSSTGTALKGTSFMLKGASFIQFVVHRVPNVPAGARPAHADLSVV